MKILNHVIILYSFVYATQGLAQENRFNYYYTKTVNLIYEHSSCRSESPGEYDQVIANNVYDIIYNYSDSEISLKSKLDLLLIMVYYERYATDNYFDITLNKYVARDSTVIKHPAYLLPIFTWRLAKACDLKAFLDQNSANITLEIENIPDEHQAYFLSTLNYLNKSVQCTEGKYAPYFPSRRLLKQYYIETDEFRNAFPSFYSIRECSY